MPGTTPLAQVLLAGSTTNALGNATDRVLMIRVQDFAGEEADTLEIVLDDRDFAIASPYTGQNLTVAMGYAETGLYPMGTYVVDSVEVRGAPYQVWVHGKSAAQNSTQKTARTTPYENQTLGQITATVAGRNGLTAACDPSLASQMFAYEHQLEESDWNFMTRLAKECDAFSTIKNGRWIITPRSGGVTGSGTAMQNIVVTLPDIISYEAGVGDRPKYKLVHARTHLLGTGKSEDSVATSSVDSAQANLTIHDLHSNPQRAQRAAQSKAEELKRRKGFMRAQINGDPTIMAVGTVTFQTGRTLLDQQWTLKNVVHAITPGSTFYTTLYGTATNDVQSGALDSNAQSEESQGPSVDELAE